MRTTAFSGGLDVLIVIQALPVHCIIMVWQAGRQYERGGCFVKPPRASFSSIVGVSVVKPREFPAKSNQSKTKLYLNPESCTMGLEFFLPSNGGSTPLVNSGMQGLQRILFKRIPFWALAIGMRVLGVKSEKCSTPWYRKSCQQGDCAILHTQKKCAFALPKTIWQAHLPT